MRPEAGRSSSAVSPRGLTLVELVVAIVVIGVGVTAVLGLIGSASRNSPGPQLRIRAVELAQSYLDEIRAVRWDERLASRSGCVDSGGSTNCPGGPDAACTAGGGCMPDGGESHADGQRSLLDDVDDFDDLAEGTACGYTYPLRESSGQDRSDRYRGYCVAVDVAFDDALNGVPAADAKRVDVHVRTPVSSCSDPRACGMTFTTFRLNF
ncbi:prepilin-type N-terminal cleavage/methylation domain-containing protein [Thiohalorhabdus methylotrophus]|uniref:Prepilin-type N-terminal cleavage/methylation domain-containing protein n=1 Tax=Thiohalorhabdus methylotrophus TaxID=3242694 RepID=A0ABV4TYA2_9GAMM